MAYGKPPMKPRMQSKKFGHAGPAGRHQAETEKAQQGKTGIEGSSTVAAPDFGTMPSSGPVEENAGHVESNTHGGSTTKAGTVKKTPGNPAAHAVHNQGAGREPQHPGSHGGPHTGSIDTLTHLFFHPEGGLGVAQKHALGPKQDGKFKDSGKKGRPEVNQGAPMRGEY
jgi:hypothetical protein